MFCRATSLCCGEVAALLITCNLTNLSRMSFPISISGTSLFQILGILGSIFHFYSISNRTFCEQTVETQIRCRGLRHLNKVCAVCLCPKKDARLIWVNTKIGELPPVL